MFRNCSNISRQVLQIHSRQQYQTIDSYVEPEPFMISNLELLFFLLGVHCNFLALLTRALNWIILSL